MGTAWFFHHAGLLDRARRHDPFVHHYEQEAFLLQPGYFSGLDRALQTRPVLKLVREPGARAYSSYLNLHTAQVLDPRDHRHAMRQQILRSAGKDPSHETLLSLTAFLEWLAREDHQRLDGHEARQTNLYDDALLPTRPEILKLEDAAQTIPRIEARFGLPLSSPGQVADFGASAHYAHKVEDRRDEIAIIVEQGLSTPRPYRIPPIMTQDLAGFPRAHAALTTAFGEDYARFGYPTYTEEVASLR